MQLSDIVETMELIETLRSKGWQIKPPARRVKSRIISEAMTAPNRKRSLAAKRMWRKRRKAA
jgi:hypothetical protein